LKVFANIWLNATSSKMFTNIRIQFGIDSLLDSDLIRLLIFDSFSDI